MTPRFRSSGDLLADRRASYADMLAASGDVQAAADLMADALGLAPDWVAGWFRLGELAEQTDPDRARAAYAHALTLDPEDLLGATLRLDLLRAVPLTETMPPAFVEALFDQYAPRFEESLVTHLQYRAPQQLAAALPDRRFEHGLDMGCGTGLMGVELRDRCDRLTGWDISEGMLAEAHAKGIYNDLARRDLNQLAPEQGQYDLIIAADVFLYLGALEGIVAWAAAALRSGGILAFSCEAHDGEGQMVLRPSRRYAHSATYLQGLLAQAGLGPVALTPVVLRQDRGADIAGYIVAAHAPARQSDRSGELEQA